MSAQDLVRQGGECEARSDWDGAERAYRAADELEDAEGAILLGLTLKRRGDLTGAADAFSRAERRGHAEAANSLGLLLQDDGDREAAEAAFRRSIERGSLNATLNLGLLFADAGAAEDALPHLEAAESGGIAEAAYVIGRMHEDRERLAEAEEAYRRAETNGDPKASFGLAAVLAKRGDEEAGRVHATLRRAEVHSAAAQQEARRFALRVGTALADAHARLLEAEPELADALQETAQLERDLLARFSERFGVDLTRQAVATTTIGGTLEEWSEEAERVLRWLARERPAMLRSGRLNQQFRFAREFLPLIESRAAVEQAALRDAYADYLRSGPQAAGTAFAEQVPELRAQLDRLAVPPPVVGWLGDGAMSTEPVPGIGRLLLHVGFAVLSPLEVATYQPGNAQPGTRVTVPTGPFALPALLDLDRDGGFVSDVATPVNNTLLRLLALLPPGQLKATIFDPARLGESASFLFGLGDATEAVVGAKVKTTERELAEALLEIEEHITFVTQKYLQGTYGSLTEYNVAAGDVAEPYRVLVLYDYPRGFGRPGGGLDEDVLARLRKIVEVGRRCGVFTFAVAADGLEAEPARSVAQLPWLFDGARPHQRWIARLVLGDADATEMTYALPSAAPSGGDRVEAARRGVAAFTGAAAATWHFLADQPAAPGTTTAILAHVERGLARSGDVRVGDDKVADLAARRLARDVSKGTRSDEVVARPGRPETWWHGSSVDGVEAVFGRAGASDVSVLRLDGATASGALVGGRPGAGKSVLLHAIVASLTRRYAPSELELYLVDFKEGVEFKAYATGALPHARVVAIESDREFGLSVLRSLDEEIARRGSVFREGAGEEVDLAAYRRRTGRPLARIVLIVDEFHVLFERDDKVAGEAAELLDRVVRQGRAFGVHCILASQTIAGTAGLGRHTLNQIPIRIALQCSDADSRLLLADDNADARLLSRPGEGIINTAQGVREANARFQAAYTTPEERATSIAQLRELADAAGVHARPVVFEGNADVRLDDVPREQFATAAGVPALPLGMPLTLGGPVTIALPREPGGNLLVVGDDEAGSATLATALACLAGAGVATDVLDFGPPDSPLAAIAEALGCAPVRRREASARIAELAGLVQERLALHEHSAAARVCVLSSLHRARELEAGGLDETAEALERILRDGPDVGVHVIAWCDKPVSLQRRLSSSAQREFGLRLLGPMSRDDSFALVDSDVAATLKRSQAVLDDHDNATTTRLRRFAMPSLDWIRAISGRA